MTYLHDINNLVGVYNQETIPSNDSIILAVYKDVARMFFRGGQRGDFWISRGVRTQISGHLYGQNKKIDEPVGQLTPKTTPADAIGGVICPL